MAEKDIIQEAIKDVKQIKELAVENAKKVLMEQLKDSVEKVVAEGISKVSDSSSKKAEIDLSELPPSDEEVKKEDKKGDFDLDDIPRSDKSDSDISFEKEAKGSDTDISFEKRVSSSDEDILEIDEPSDSSKSSSEDLLGGEEETPEQKIQKQKLIKSLTKSEAEELDISDSDEDDEEEFSDEEIEEAYNQLFKEVEIPPVDSEVSSSDTLASKVGKEKQPAEVEPPAGKDFVPKEYFDRVVRNAGLKLIEYRRQIKRLLETIKEVNLLNSKLLAVEELNKLVSNKGLKKKIINAIDKANTIDEVKNIKSGLKDMLLSLNENDGHDKAIKRIVSEIPISKGADKKSVSIFERQKRLAGIGGTTIYDDDFEG